MSPCDCGRKSPKEDPSRWEDLPKRRSSHAYARATPKWETDPLESHDEIGAGKVGEFSDRCPQRFVGSHLGENLASRHVLGFNRISDIATDNRTARWRDRCGGDPNIHATIRQLLVPPHVTAKGDNPFRRSSASHSLPTKARRSWSPRNEILSRYVEHVRARASFPVPYEDYMRRRSPSLYNPSYSSSFGEPSGARMGVPCTEAGGAASAGFGSSSCTYMQITHKVAIIWPSYGLFLTKSRPVNKAS